LYEDTRWRNFLSFEGEPPGDAPVLTDKYKLLGDLNST